MIKDRAPLVANPPDLNGVLSGMSFPEIALSDNILQAQADMPLVSILINRSYLINSNQIILYSCAFLFELIATFYFTPLIYTQIQHSPGELGLELQPNLILPMDVAEDVARVVAKDVAKGRAKGRAKPKGLVLALAVSLKTIKVRVRGEVVVVKKGQLNQWMVMRLKGQVLQKRRRLLERTQNNLVML